MAFGDVKGTFSAAANSITNPFVATGSVAVVVGDLIYCVLVQQTGLTVTAVNDNLGNTYSALNAGNDAGAVTARAFYSRVTVAGTCTGPSATTTASANNVVFIGVAFEGPFNTSPLDANPANGTGDVTSPFTCPATGTLAQAEELVVAWGAANYNTAWAATSPNVERIETASSTLIKGDIGSQVVSSTSTISPAFTSAGNPTECILGTSSFRRTQDLTPSLYEDADAFFTQAVSPGVVDLAPSLYEDADAFFTQAVSPGVVDLAPSLYVDTDTFGSPTVSGGVDLVRTTRLGQDFNDAGAGANIVTPSFTPSDNSLLVVAFGGVAYQNDLTSDNWSVVGGGLTWTRRKRITDVNGVDAGYKSFHEVWTAPVVTGASMTVTFDHPALGFTAEYLAFAVSIVDFTGYDTGSPVGADASGSDLGAGAASITLSASPAASSEVFASLVFIPWESPSTSSPGSGWSEIQDIVIQGTFPWGNFQTQERGGSTSDNVAWADTQVEAGNTELASLALAVEIKAASESEEQDLAPPLFANSATFFAPTVAPGAVSLAPSLYSDADAFFTQTVAAGAGLGPSLYVDDDAFAAATVGSSFALSASLYADGETFFDLAVTPGSVSLSPALYSDGDSFFTQAISVGAVALAPAHYSDGDTFFVAAVNSGELVLSPELYSDADTIPSHALGSSIALLPSLWVDSDILFVPAVTAGPVQLLPPLYVDADTFCAAQVGGGVLRPDVIVAAQRASPAIVSATRTAVSVSAVRPPAVEG